MGRFRGVLAALAVLASCAGLAGCAPPPEPPAPSAPIAAPTASPTPSPTHSVAAPQYDPDGSARSNLDYFDAVNRKLFAAKADATGRAIVDNLARAGFDKRAMQVTPDRTPIGNRTDSIEFSVRLDAQCLIGQSSGGSYTSLVAPALADGACLVGKTRPIDW
ncbi:MAG TPA: hypothetical protein VIQ26_02585 [Microbacteriaceae bacterium]